VLVLIASRALAAVRRANHLGVTYHRVISDINGRSALMGFMVTTMNPMTWCFFRPRHFACVEVRAIPATSVFGVMNPSWPQS
jgi:hypothetical protein